MTAVAIAGLAVALAAVAAAVYFGRAALAAKDERLTAAERAHAAERAEADAEEAQLDAVERAKAAELGMEQERAGRLAQKARADRAEEVLRGHIRKTIVDGDDDAVAALVSGMLALDLAGAAAAPNGPGDAADTARLRPAAAAGADHGGVGPVAGGRR